MRLYLSGKEASTIIGALLQAYQTQPQDVQSEIQIILERMDVCLELQGQPKPKTGVKNQNNQFRVDTLN